MRLDQYSQFVVVDPTRILHQSSFMNGASRNYSRKSGLAWLLRQSLVVVVGAWALLQVLANQGSIGPDSRSFFLLAKNLCGPVVFLLCVLTLMLPGHAILRWKSGLERERGFLLLSIMLPSYVALVNVGNMLTTDYSQRWAETLLYFIFFPLFVFVLPAVVNSRAFFSRLLVTLSVGTTIGLGLTVFLGFRNESLSEWLSPRNRVSFDFINPNLFASSVQVIFAIVLVWFVRNRGNPTRRAALVLLLVACLTLVVLAKSESTLGFCLIAIIFVCLDSSKKRSLRLHRLAWVLIALASLSVVTWLWQTPQARDLRTVDDWASGRLTVWGRSLIINETLSDPVTFLFGTDRLEAANLLFSGERGGLKYRRAQVDSVYLGFLVGHGFIGFGLLLALFWAISARLLKLLRISQGVQRDVTSVVAGIWLGALVQMSAAATFPSFGHPGTMMLMIMMSYPLHQSCQPRTV